jgi:hypothetical protein
MEMESTETELNEMEETLLDSIQPERTMADKINLLKDIALPLALKRNKSAAKLLNTFEIESGEIMKELNELTPEQKKLPEEQWQNKKLFRASVRARTVNQILKNKQEFHYFCEVRERTKRDRDGEPPTEWEFIEYLFLNKTENSTKHIE